MHGLNQFLFGIFPYIALTVFFLGSILRYDRDQYTWKADSSQFLRSKGMSIGNNLFHVGIILLFFGHLVGLLTPEGVYHYFMTSAVKQQLAMIAGGIFGGLAFIGMSMLVYRRLFDPRIKATSKNSDIAILLILYIQLILGLITIWFSAQHLDGSSMVALANWAQYILTFRSGAADFVMGTDLIFKLHLVLGMTIFLIFPFTRLVHIWSAPIQYLFRKGYQVVRKRA